MFGDIWDWFTSGFCKVEFLCYAGDPNWMGWGVLGIGVLFIIGIVQVLD